MSRPNNFDAGPDDPDDAAIFAAASSDLVDAVDAAVPGWIVRLVVDRIEAWSGAVSSDWVHEAARAGDEARAEAVTAFGALFAQDVDDQDVNPLAVLRRVTVHAHRVLAAADVPAIERDPFAERAFPDDVYDLVPATWADIDPALAEPGLTWSAAKAFIFKARRRREGRT